MCQFCTRWQKCLMHIVIIFGTFRKGEGSKVKGMLLNRLTTEPEGYAECYPGLEEMQDAIDDSDDEVRYVLTIKQN